MIVKKSGDGFLSRKTLKWMSPLGAVDQIEVIDKMLKGPQLLK
jgi:hypothetical protein